ncbi:MAG: TonB-dependent receptor [Tannerella sp.]|jgi:TonB-linked SusC/RagA family outer membrane protein|nr:TonB-dependent receptor [Tannerella sp.]
MNKHVKQKLFTLFLLLVFFCNADTIAQQKTEITINLKNASLKEVFNAIEKQTTYRFSYRDAVIDTLKNITISKANASVSSVLDETLKDRNLEYSIVSAKSIVISDRKKNAVLPTGSKRISGIVLDDSGGPVVGANVTIKGTTIGNITDIDGNFGLDAPEDGILVVSYIGYLPQEMSVRNKNNFTIELKEDLQALDEVVVVGYGVQKKSDVTGALTRVSEKVLKERPVQNALQAMQGKAAGVQITLNNRPGELGEIRVRGNRSINASNDPLYVIDGIPMIAGSMSDINPNDIESIEILKDASATAIYGSRAANGVILITSKKGKAGRTSINYDGTITFSDLHSLTDWMNAGEQIDWNRQARINAGSYTGKYGNAPDPDVDSDILFSASGYPYMQPVFESAFRFNADGTPVMRDATDYERNALGYADRIPVYNSANIPTTPWRDYVTRTAITNNHQVSISSGTEKTSLYMSLSYLDQQAALIDQSYKRYSVNINGDAQATKWLKAGIGLNAGHSIQNYGIVDNSSNTVAKDSYGLAMNLAQYAPAYDTDGSLLRVNNGPSYHNVLRNIEEAQNETRNYSLMMSSYAEATLLPWLKWRTNFGTQFRNSRLGNYYSNEFTNPTGAPGSAPNVAYNNQSTRLAWTLENLIYANKTFNNIHTLGVTLMQSAEHYRTESLNVRAYESIFPTALWYNVGSSDLSKVNVGSGFNQQQRASCMARLNYNLMDKYLLTLTGRWDGASMLAEGNKWDFFPSAALAWKMRQEDFMEHIDWISEIKPRIGYGVTGNAAISSYQTGGTMSSTYANMTFGQGNVSTATTGAKAVILPNRLLGWEKTASTNIGVDFGVLKNRITGSFEYYISNTSDLLLNRSIPMMTGYTSILSNIGKTQNKGVEVTLSTVNINTKNFTWRTDFTFFANKEKIVELSDGKTDDPANGWFIGKPIDEVWTKKYDRIWQDNTADRKLLALYKANGITMMPGQAKIVDQPFIEVAKGTDGSVTKTITLDGEGIEATYMDNGFGVINNDDNIFQGSFLPKWEGGFTTVFTYKNFELSSFLYGRFGGVYYGLIQTYGMRNESDIWSKDNPNGKYPQPLSGGQSFTDYSSYMNYTKGNMVVVRNIALSYTVPETLLRKAGVANCSVYGQVLNPFIFGGELVKAGINPDDMTGWRANSRSNGDFRYIGGQTNNTIITRSFVIGLRLGF